MTTSALYRDRQDAGRALVRKLADYAGRSDVVVLALSKAGVPVAVEVAEALRAPLDLFLVHKMRLPGHEELIFGAVISGGVRVLIQDVVQDFGIPDELIDTVASREDEALQQREQTYRANRPRPELRDRTVILVDDGMATGARMWAAVMAARKQQPARIVVAVPAAPPDLCEAFENEVDDIVCVERPEQFLGISSCYADNAQVTDAEVRELLDQAARSGLRDNDSFYGIPPGEELT